MGEQDVPTVLPVSGPSAGDAATEGAAGVTVPGDTDQTRPGAEPPSGSGSGPALRRGDRIDKFIVDRELGAGAMGVVLLAVDPELDRKVAIKLLANTARGDVGQARLVREAQSAARVQHPNVVAVFQVGTHEGQVFLVMEYVDGGTLRGWLAEAERPWSEIVDAYVQAGRGLAAAHAAGLVHRDFKPDNVLIGRDGRVRVSDFGLVGVSSGPTAPTPISISSSLSGDSKLTRTGALMGTPAYMSPEQIAATAIDARSDQFSFCVALFEALYGRRPYPGDTLPNLVASIEGERLEPPPDDGEVPAHVRQALLVGLSRRPEDRHPDMSTLLDALVPRRPRRRRAVLVVGALALMGASAAAATWATGAPSFECPDPATEYGAAWDDDARDATRATLAEHPRADAIFSAIDAELSAEREAWIEAWKEACSARADDRLTPVDFELRRSCLDDARDEVTAFVGMVDGASGTTLDGAQTLANAVGRVDDCRDAAVLATRAATDDDRRQRLATTARERLQVRAALAGGDFRAVLELTDALLPELRGLDVPAATARMLVHRARAGISLGEIAEQEDELREAVRLAADAHDPATEALGLATLVFVIASQPDRYGEALGSIAAAEAAAERSGDPAARAFVGVAVGTVRSRAGEHDAANARLTDAIERLSDRPALGVDILAEAYIARAEVHLARDEAESAAGDFERARTTLTAAWGPSHPVVGRALAREGDALFGRQRFVDAEAKFRAAVEALSVSLGPDHPETIARRIQVGRCLMHQGKSEVARDALADVLARFERAEIDDPRLETSIVENLAWLEGTVGRRHESIVYFERALGLLARIGEPDAARIPRVEESIAWAWWQEGDYAKARVHFERARDAHRERLGPKHVQVLLQIAAIGDTYEADDDCETAQKYYRRALKLVSDLEGADAAHARVLLSMGECELAEGDVEAARDTLDYAYRLREAEGLSADFVAPILFARGRVHALDGQRSRGVELAREALALYEANPFAYEAEMAEIRTWLSTHAG